ncbi:helix-turn-helix transcriptional regulator [Sulfitobacter sp. S46]|nr:MULTISPECIES: helix-turn-helix transcriptional regulator [unclassified Sulfitobacter]MDF3420105.1 helix-turn-helix transcriptional regulator [Sulfitobacter sp. Ks38]MDF3431169.1 helix-turn-helix transcriptional regulator [Sulfitobacter sp. S46]MDF3445942.1 helix-turn-helix transcriptional regulator [Sulfitobacter sp. KE31]MDF3549951.1 helix-turn-helix transcriptional regulator [Sulfitobacter sp. KE28]
MNDIGDELPIYAQNLQRILRERNLQQSEVAEASGLKRDGFGRYYHGKTKPPAKKLIAIAAALKVKPSDIDPESVSLDNIEAEHSADEFAYQMTPAMSRRPGYLTLRVNVELPAGMAVRIAETIEKQLNAEQYENKMDASLLEMQMNRGFDD